MIRSDVAAVMLCWNDVARVCALARRLERLEPAPGRTIIVDNGSRADTAVRIAEGAPPCEIIALGRNHGFAAAINRGIDAAIAGGAQWVWVLNTDVELPGAALGELLSAAERDPGCGMAAAVLLEADGAVLAFGGGRVNLWTGLSRHVQRSGERCDYLVGACLLLRTAMLRDVGLFDESYFFYWEDIELSFRAREAGWRLAVAESCRVVHLEGSSLGRWSDERWYHLFRGLTRFLAARSPLPRVATALRLAQHSATMLRHGRAAALRGAWRAVAGGSGR